MVGAIKFLESLQRFDLATLLGPCELAIVETEVNNGFYQDLVQEAVVRAPPPIDEALRALPLQDRKRISEAIAATSANTTTPDDISVQTINAPVVGGAPGLLGELLVHRAMMVAVATGGPRIQEVDDYYRAREARIRQTLPEGVAYENPHPDLWDWYRHWSGSLPQYKDRRFYVRQLFAPAIEAISTRRSLTSIREPTGWERVDRALSKARTQLDTASAEEDYQAIGLLCREIIISLAQAVYDPTIHESLDGIAPSDTDANRMLEAYIAHVFPGGSYKEVRAHARASLALTLNLQHRRTANRQLAALCVEATASTTAVISIIGRARQ